MALRSPPSPTSLQRARLRNRIIVRIGVLVALLAAILGVTTYFVIRSTLIEERETSAERQFSTHAVVLASALRSSTLAEAELLAALRPEVRARELLLTRGEWFSSSLQIQPADLPDELVAAVLDGQPSRQRFRSREGPMLGLGAEIDSDAVYFEVFSLEDLEDTLGTLRNTLAGAGIFATALGMAVGWWIARRVTRPLEQVSAAAVSIADGDLDTRLDGAADRDLARISSSFNRMADSLQARIAREVRFAADVSHELRSPLTTLVNAATVLERRRHELSAGGQEALDLLVGDLQRFERMVTDLVEISKHDAGTATVTSERIDAAAFVQSVLRRSGHLDVAVEVVDPAGNAVLEADEQRLERTLRNLLENADAYGEGVQRVVVDARGDDVVIAVDDSGPGVPEDERARIFDRFSRGTHGERRSTADGSGLGLSLAHENVRASGGRIWVEDNPAGGGARFVVSLPRWGR